MQNRINAITLRDGDQWLAMMRTEPPTSHRSHALFDVKEGREKVLPMAPALRTLLSQERQAHPAEVWLLDDGAGKLVYHPASALT